MRHRPTVNRRSRVHVITMGCAKNTVDSERLMAQLRLNDIEISPSIENADVAVINTCGFIDAAKAESIDMIIETVKRKGKGSLKRVIAMGCLTERYRDEIIAEVPELDAVFGSRQPRDVLAALGAELKHELLGERVLTTPRHVAYLKISEGCDRPCSFCAIPLMRGNHRTEPVESLLDEAKRLLDRGTKEIVVIGQDTTAYGMDLYGERRLSGLLRSLADLDGIEWVRLMYAYPAHFPPDVLDIMASHPRICKYLDLPVQHGSDRILRSMRRGISARSLRDLVATIREKVPGVVLRTTIIVGYPEESEKEFHELMDFLRESRFERLGVFTYSQEEGTNAYPLGDPIAPEEKERRRGAVMELQREISRQRNERLIGTHLRMIVDEMAGDTAVGRTEGDAPEIDNEAHCRTGNPVRPGDFVMLEVQDADDYDIFGVPSQAEADADGG